MSMFCSSLVSFSDDESNKTLPGPVISATFSCLNYTAAQCLFLLRPQATRMKEGGTKGQTKLPLQLLSCSMPSAMTDLPLPCKSWRPALAPNLLTSSQVSADACCCTATRCSCSAPLVVFAVVFCMMGVPNCNRLSMVCKSHMCMTLLAELYRVKE